MIIGLIEKADGLIFVCRGRRDFLYVLMDFLCFHMFVCRMKGEVFYTREAFFRAHFIAYLLGGQLGHACVVLG